MAVAYRYFGPCVPQVGVGTGGALVVLGICRKGGRVAIEFKDRDIKDDGGGDAAIEIQQMGAEAMIEFEIERADNSVLDLLIAAAMGGATLGQIAAPGTLLGTGGFLKPLYLPSSTDLPWYFPSTKLLPVEGTYGTEAIVNRLRFRAIPFLAATTSDVTGTVLFTRSAPG